MLIHGSSNPLWKFFQLTHRDFFMIRNWTRYPRFTTITCAPTPVALIGDLCRLVHTILSLYCPVSNMYIMLLYVVCLIWTLKKFMFWFSILQRQSARSRQVSHIYIFHFICKVNGLLFLEVKYEVLMRERLCSFNTPPYFWMSIMGNIFWISSPTNIHVQRFELQSGSSATRMPQQ